LQVSLPTQYNGENQKPVGALANALGRLQASRPLRELRETVKGVTKQLPEAIQEATSKIDEYARGMISGSGSTLFEELGLYYIGPIDGHNLENLLAVLQGLFPPSGKGTRGGGATLGPSTGKRWKICSPYCKFRFLLGMNRVERGGGLTWGPLRQANLYDQRCVFVGSFREGYVCEQACHNCTINKHIVENPQPVLLERKGQWPQNYQYTFREFIRQRRGGPPHYLDTLIPMQWGCLSCLCHVARRSLSGGSFIAVSQFRLQNLSVPEHGQACCRCRRL